MDKTIRVLAVFSVFGFSVPSFALIKGKVHYGMRKGKATVNSSTGKQSLDSTDLGLSALLDPIPLIPVAIGADLTNLKFDVNQDHHGLDELTGTRYAFLLKAWVPIPGSFTPYGQLGLTSGKYEGEAAISNALYSVDYEVEYKSSGNVLALGVEWEPVSLPVLDFAIFLEYEISNEKVKRDSSSATVITAIGSATFTDNSSAKFDYNSTAIILGVIAGI